MGPREKLFKISSSCTRILLIMVHDFSPFIWRIAGDFGIRWYGFSYLLGFLLAYLMIHWLVKRQRSGLATNMIGDFVTFAAIGVLFGGRLGYVVFYSPDLFIRFKADFPFWGVLALNEGGMSAHGAMIGLVLACIGFAVKSGSSLLYLFDLVAISGPIGVFFGRLANFFNGELVGRTSDASYQFAFKFPQDILFWPNFEFAKLGSLGDIVAQLPDHRKEQWLSWLDTYRVNEQSQESVIQTLILVIEAVQNGNASMKNELAPLLEFRHPWPLYAAVGEGLFIFLFLFILWYRPRRPGVISATFLVLYALVRIIIEQFRLPDQHLGLLLFNLTMGQWLSLVMLIVGIVFLFLWGRRETLRTPGWGRGQHVKIHRR